VRLVSSLALGAMVGLLGPSAVVLLPGSSLSSTFTFLAAAPIFLPILGGLVYVASSFLIEDEEVLSMRLRAARTGTVMLGLFFGLVGVLILTIAVGGR
jgi:hypothetical protein